MNADADCYCQLYRFLLRGTEHLTKLMYDDLIAFVTWFFSSDEVDSRENIFFKCHVL